jgi:hypothetical protein
MLPLLALLFLAQGVEDAMRADYPRLMHTYDVVSRDLAWYIEERQGKFLV